MDARDAGDAGPASPLALAGIAVAVFVAAWLAPTPVRADQVIIESRTASGARGDAILVKPSPLGAAVDFKSAAPSSSGPQAYDPLRGLALDPMREAVIAATGTSMSGIQVRDRRVGEAASKTVAPDGAGAAPSGASAAATDVVSPVYVDAAGNVRALPGGVIVTVDGDVGPEAARSAIEASGQVVERELAPGIWLVRTAGGDAAVEAARSLAAHGGFRSVEPNWWRAPVPK